MKKSPSGGFENWSATAAGTGGYPARKAEAATALPYAGATPHYILDIEDKALTLAVIAILEPITPLPKPKKKRLK